MDEASPGVAPDDIHAELDVLRQPLERVSVDKARVGVHQHQIHDAGAAGGDEPPPCDGGAVVVCTVRAEHDQRVHVQHQPQEEQRWPHHSFFRPLPHDAPPLPHQGDVPREFIPQVLELIPPPIHVRCEEKVVEDRAEHPRAAHGPSAAGVATRVKYSQEPRKRQALMHDG